MAELHGTLWNMGQAGRFDSDSSNTQSVSYRSLNYIENTSESNTADFNHFRRHNTIPFAPTASIVY